MSGEQKKTAAITGATGAIGYAIAEQIARLPGWVVVLIVRDLPRGKTAAKKITSDTGNPDIRVMKADLGELSEIELLRNRWNDRLDVLVNNAALTPRRRIETKEGHEAQWGVNVLGYWRMANLFCDLLSRSAPSRLVNVASYWAGGMNLSDPEFHHRNYNNDNAYRQSKQADRMMSVMLSREWKTYGISVNACHPGDVNSRLSNNLGFGGSMSSADGAATPVWLATGFEAESISGKWVMNGRADEEKFAADSVMMKRLRNILDQAL